MASQTVQDQWLIAEATREALGDVVSLRRVLYHVIVCHTDSCAMVVALSNRLTLSWRSKLPD
jgi:hypothetical protein